MLQYHTKALGGYGYDRIRIYISNKQTVLIVLSSVVDPDPYPHGSSKK